MDVMKTDRAIALQIAKGMFVIVQEKLVVLKLVFLGARVLENAFVRLLAKMDAMQRGQNAVMRNAKMDVIQTVHVSVRIIV